MKDAGKSHEPQTVFMGNLEDKTAMDGKVVPLFAMELYGARDRSADTRSAACRAGHVGVGLLAARCGIGASTVTKKAPSKETHG